MRILVLLLSAWMAVPGLIPDALAQPAQQVPPGQEPPPQQTQPQPSPPPQPPAERATPTPPPSALPTPAPQRRAEAATEYWPAIRGYRLKISDTLIVAVMVLLLCAVWLQWRATRKLVRDAQRNAERQLRAYLAVVPKAVGGLRTDVVGSIEWTVRNLGQTPAQKVTHRYNFVTLPNPLPARHRFPEPTREFANSFTLLPGDEMVCQFDGEAAFTAQQVEAISRNEARLYCWGYTEYEDVFRVTWRARFSVSAGGEAFTRAMSLPPGHASAPPWSWEHSSGHNEIVQA